MIVLIGNFSPCQIGKANQSFLEKVYPMTSGIGVHRHHQRLPDGNQVIIIPQLQKHRVGNYQKVALFSFFLY
jgi:hypothetical protein